MQERLQRLLVLKINTFEITTTAWITTLNTKKAVVEPPPLKDFLANVTFIVPTRHNMCQKRPQLLRLCLCIAIVIHLHEWDQHALEDMVHRGWYRDRVGSPKLIRIYKTTKYRTKLSTPSCTPLLWLGATSSSCQPSTFCMSKLVTLLQMQCFHHTQPLAVGETGPVSLSIYSARGTPYLCLRWKPPTNGKLTLHNGAVGWSVSGAFAFARSSSGILWRQEIPQSWTRAVFLAVRLADRKLPPRPTPRWKFRRTCMHLCWGCKGYFQCTAHSALSCSRVTAAIWGGPAPAFSGRCVVPNFAHTLANARSALGQVD